MISKAEHRALTEGRGVSHANLEAGLTGAQAFACETHPRGALDGAELDPIFVKAVRAVKPEAWP